MAQDLKKLIEELVQEALDEVNTISTGGGSVQSSGKISGTGGNPLGRDMSDQHEIMWSGDEPDEEEDDRDLDEINALSTGNVVGYTLPIGMKPDYSKLDDKKKKKKKRRWYEV